MMSTKVRILVLCAAVILLSVIPSAVNGQTKYVPKTNEEIYGTWTNQRTINAFQIQKMVVGAGGFKEYGNVSDSSPRVEVTQQIDSKWTDSSRNVWYKVFGRINTGPWKGRNFKALEKLSQAASVLEMVVNAYQGDFNSSDYPNKIEKVSAFDGGYRIFYRAKK